MISSPFNTSASNFGNAAMQTADVPWDTPVKMRLGADGPGETGAYIEVSTTRGFAKRIPIDEARLFLSAGKSRTVRPGSRCASNSSTTWPRGSRRPWPKRCAVERPGRDARTCRTLACLAECADCGA